MLTMTRSVCCVSLFLKYMNIGIDHVDTINPKFNPTVLSMALTRSNNNKITAQQQGAQWLSGIVLDSRPRERGFEPHKTNLS